MGLRRALKHLLLPDWAAKRAFPAPARKQVEQAIGASEAQHDAELRFVVEGTLSAAFLFQSPRKRAEDLFAELGVWDTEHNSGVLIYVQLVDRRIEIVADRGIAAKVAQAEWDTVCRAMEESFRRGRYLEGALEGIERVSRHLARHFPARGANPNELPDQPVIL